MPSVLKILRILRKYLESTYFLAVSLDFVFFNVKNVKFVVAHKKFRGNLPYTNTHVYDLLRIPIFP